MFVKTHDWTICEKEQNEKAQRRLTPRTQKQVGFILQTANTKACSTTTIILAIDSGTL